MSILEIAEKLNQNGGRLYLVGGAVRDRLRGKESHDEDYCVTGISQAEFQDLFPDAFLRGKSFAVFELEHKEFALARTERKSGTGHKGFEIITDKNLTIEEDLARRDLTVNSIAQDVLTGELIDPFHGKEDLQTGILRATTEHFKEDVLRVYRAARFSAQLNLPIERDTLLLMASLKNELPTLSPERVTTEFCKALLSDHPARFFDTLRDADVLEVHFPEVFKLIGAIQPPQYHPEGDAYAHTIIVLNQVVEATKDLEENRKLEIRFSALAHDFGKGETPKEVLPHHYGHEERGIHCVERIGKRLKLPTRLIECGTVCSRDHMRGGIFSSMRIGKQVEFIERVGKSRLGLDGMQIIVNADSFTGSNFAVIGKQCLESVTGKMVMEKYQLKPGPQVAELLHQERIQWLKQHLMTQS